MNYLELALDHASKGYYVFPAQESNKRPKRGFMDWEANASTDPEDIRKWWSDGNWLPAVAPGRTGHAVIDVDRHPGKPDGFKILDEENVNMHSKVQGTSLSGNGTHFWYKHDVGSLNGVLVSVDRKAQGGYVVVPYVLPEQSEITEPLPEKLAGGIATVDVERNYKSVAELNTWLRIVGQGEPSGEMYEELERFRRTSGNSEMSKAIARVVSMAAGQSRRKEYAGKYFPGATFILDAMKEHWMSVPHSSGDPEEEFQVNVRSAIEKFGEMAPDTSWIDQFHEKLNAPTEVSLSITDLWASLLMFCRRSSRDWETTQNHPEVVEMFSRFREALSRANTTLKVENWRIRTKNIISELIERIENGQED